GGGVWSRGGKGCRVGAEPDRGKADEVARGDRDCRHRHRAENAHERTGYERPHSREGPPHVPAEALAGGADTGWEELREVRRESGEAADSEEAVERHEPQQRLDRRDLGN